MNKAIFLDKDGTLINDVPYNVDPQYIAFTEKAGEALKRLKQEGYLLIIATNQSGVARGYFDIEDLKKVKASIQEKLQKNHDIEIDGFYYCPHYPTGVNTQFVGQCRCRKPENGLLLKAAHDFNINLKKSWMIGDRDTDILAGRSAGCRTILISKTEGSSNLWEAAKIIIPANSKKKYDKAARYY